MTEKTSGRSRSNQTMKPTVLGSESTYRLLSSALTIMI